MGEFVNSDKSELISTTLQIPLILDTVFNNLSTKDLFPLRKVCHLWKAVIDPIFRDNFQYELHTKEWKDRNWIDGKNYFKSLEITKIYFHWCDEMEDILEAAFNLKEFGNQIRTLKIGEVSMDFGSDLAALEYILSFTPNLEKLELKIDDASASHVLKFYPKCDNVKDVKIQIEHTYDDADAIASHILKISPNLSVNFFDPGLDQHLFQSLIEKKDPMFSMKEMKIWSATEEEFGLAGMLKNIHPKILPNLKVLFVELGILNRAVENFAKCVEMCLSNFDKSLEYVTMEHDFAGSGNIELNCFTINIPPLPKLRKLILAIPPIIDGEPAYLWNLGKQMAKDFPNLEKLSFTNDSGNDTYEDSCNWGNYRYPESWLIWEPIIPLIENETVDLSPFKAIKFVDFNLPKHWFKQDGIMALAKSFITVYYKLYKRIGGNGGSEEVQMLRRLIENEDSNGV